MKRIIYILIALTALTAKAGISIANNSDTEITVVMQTPMGNLHAWFMPHERRYLDWKSYEDGASVYLFVGPGGMSVWNDIPGTTYTGPDDEYEFTYSTTGVTGGVSKDYTYSYWSHWGYKIVWPWGGTPPAWAYRSEEAWVFGLGATFGALVMIFKRALRWFKRTGNEGGSNGD